MIKLLKLLIPAALIAACGAPEVVENTDLTADSITVVQPRIISEKVLYDTDDPAIWINPNDVLQSLVIGTDKDKNGGIYAFNLKGEIVDSFPDLNRPNNVDVAYGLPFKGDTIDIAVVSERNTHKVRVLKLPELEPIDNGGIPAFVGDTLEEYRDLMGIAVFQPRAGEIHVIVGRKTGPTDGTYLSQIKIYPGDSGYVQGEELRRFGAFSGINEIEAIAVDHKLGFIYYSDEGAGIRKYYADPAKGNAQLAFFGTSGFAEDHEGISIYQSSDSTGYILVSDQQRNAFRIFPREGSNGDPHNHPELGFVYTATSESDGSDVVTNDFGGLYPGGLFVAMSDDKTFKFFAWDDLFGASGLEP